jgi:hypothetical protein
MDRIYGISQVDLSFFNPEQFVDLLLNHCIVFLSRKRMGTAWSHNLKCKSVPESAKKRDVKLIAYLIESSSSCEWLLSNSLARARVWISTSNSEIERSQLASDVAFMRFGHGVWSKFFWTRSELNCVEDTSYLTINNTKCYRLGSLVIFEQRQSRAIIADRVACPVIAMQKYEGCAHQQCGSPLCFRRHFDQSRGWHRELWFGSVC